MSKTQAQTFDDYPTDDDCPHDNRTTDEPLLYCFECWMAERPGTSFTMEADNE